MTPLDARLEQLSFRKDKDGNYGQHCWQFILMKGQDSSPERLEFRFRSAQLTSQYTASRGKDQITIVKSFKAFGLGPNKRK